MNAVRLLRGTAIALGLMLGGALAVAATSVSDTPAPAEKPIVLDKFEVQGTRDYQPIEPGWYHAKTAHFDVYTKDKGAGLKIANELIEVRGTSN